MVGEGGSKQIDGLFSWIFHFGAQGTKNPIAAASPGIVAAVVVVAKAQQVLGFCAPKWYEEL